MFHLSYKRPLKILLTDGETLVFIGGIDQAAVSIFIKVTCGLVWTTVSKVAWVDDGVTWDLASFTDLFDVIIIYHLVGPQNLLDAENAVISKKRL